LIDALHKDKTKQIINTGNQDKKNYETIIQLIFLYGSECLTSKNKKSNGFFLTAETSWLWKIAEVYRLQKIRNDDDIRWALGCQTT